MRCVLRKAFLAWFVWASALLAAAQPAGGSDGRSARLAPPVLTGLSPTRGHTAGGTVVTVRGAHFRRSSGLKCMFAVEGELAVVPAQWLSSAAITCESPARSSAHVATLTVSNGGGYSGPALGFTAGAGTQLAFTFDASLPGCHGCGEGGPQAALPVALRVREAWTSEPDAGPRSGGTAVVITATGLVAPDGSALSSWYDRVPEGAYWSFPSGNTAAGPRPGPPPLGTFLQGRHLSCLIECGGVAAADGPFTSGDAIGWNVSTALRGRREGSMAVTVPAEFLSETSVRCVTAPWPQPTACLAGAGASACAADNCTIRIGNAADAYDDALFGAQVHFNYSSAVPNITRISSRHNAPQLLYSARGPMAGGTEVTLTGTDFLPSSQLTCRFDATVVPAVFDTPARVRCVSPHMEANGLRGVQADYDPQSDLWPCFVANVSVSNDGGIFAPAARPFLYCDIHVTASGSDDAGDGTPGRPYQTLQRGIDAALAGPRAGPGADGAIVNRDRVRVGPAIYRGPGNVGLSAGGKAVRLVATGGPAAHVTAIDCEQQAGVWAPGQAGLGVALLVGVAAINCIDGGGANSAQIGSACAPGSRGCRLVNADEVAEWRAELNGATHDLQSRMAEGGAGLAGDGRWRELLHMRETVDQGPYRVGQNSPLSWEDLADDESAVIFPEAAP